MKVTHFLSENKKTSKEVKDVSFLTSNNVGDFLWLGGEKIESRYEGWFCRLPQRSDFDNSKENFFNLFRIIENIVVVGDGVFELQNEINHIKRKRGSFWELFCLREDSHTLVYEISKRLKIDVFFDVKEAYSTDETVNFKVEKEEDVWVVQFDNGIFLAINGERLEVVSKKEEHFYNYDKKRNSPPFQRNVFCGVSLYGKRVIFSVSRNKKEAVKEVKKVFLREVVKEKDEIDVICAKRALKGFLVLEDDPGLYAGFPWFFHFWQRDEAVALRSFFSINSEKGKKIFFRLLESGFKKGPLGVVNIDAIYWTFKRAEDVLPFCDVIEKEKIRRYLKKYLEEFLWAFTEDDFAINRPYETWMDTLERSGARIEIQTMRLYMYKLAGKLAKRRSEKIFYKKMEKQMKKKVKKVFFDGKNLYDGYYPQKNILEKIIRPNIFIAYYFYPELLTKGEWKSCFDSALSALWLEWGGVATVDKENSNFFIEHTGEDSKSYHQGDSWFYINNITAICLFRLDKKRYKEYIKKIMEASRKEMLWKGAVGHHGELSSAVELRSEGCVSQLWSVATYLEAKKEGIN